MVAEPLKIISSMATRQTLAELTDLYAQRTGHPVDLKSMGGVDAARQVRVGADADIVILASGPMEKLEHEGHLVAGGRHNFAVSGIAIAVRAGVQPPAIHTERDIRAAVLEHKFCFSTGPSGDHLKSLLQRWGLSDLLLQRGVQAPAGVPVVELLARGDADIGFQQLSELLDHPGADVVGLLPSETQASTTFSAGISQTSARKDHARALIAFLISQETAAVKQRHGMKSPDSTRKVG